MKDNNSNVCIYFLFSFTMIPHILSLWHIFSKNHWLKAHFIQLKLKNQGARNWDQFLKSLKSKEPGTVDIVIFQFNLH